MSWLDRVYVAFDGLVDAYGERVNKIEVVRSMTWAVCCYSWWCGEIAMVVCLRRLGLGFVLGAGKLRTLYHPMHYHFLCARLRTRTSSVRACLSRRRTTRTSWLPSLLTCWRCANTCPGLDASAHA